MKTITFKITQEDIDSAKSYYSNNCVIGRALQRIGFEEKDIKVGGEYFFIGNDRYVPKDDVTKRNFSEIVPSNGYPQSALGLVFEMKYNIHCSAY